MHLPGNENGNTGHGFSSWLRRSGTRPIGAGGLADTHFRLDEMDTIGFMAAVKPIK
jgi:hypothetical protein